MKLKKIFGVALAAIILSTALGVTTIAGIDPHSWHFQANTIQEN